MKIWHSNKYVNRISKQRAAQLKELKEMSVHRSLNAQAIQHYVKEVQKQQHDARMYNMRKLKK